MPVPGVGPGIAYVILSYLGNEERFPGTAETADCAGLTLRTVVPGRQPVSSPCSPTGRGTCGGVLRRGGSGQPEVGSAGRGFSLE